MIKKLITLISCIFVVVFVLVLPDQIGAAEFELLGRAPTRDHLYNNEIPFKVYYAGDYWSVAVRVDSGQTTGTYNLLGKKGTSLHMLTYLGNTQEVPDKTKVAEVIIRYLDGTTTTVDLIAGLNTAEWAWDRPGAWFFEHSKPAPGYSWYEGDGRPPEISSQYGRYLAHMFYAQLPLEYKSLDLLELKWTAGTQYDPIPGVHAAVWINALTLAKEPWRAISAGKEHTVAIKSDGTLWAWGGNQYGQLGDGSLNASRVPKKIGSKKDWVKVSAGFDHTVAIKSDGTLWAWGRNEYGQLGDGNRGFISRVPKKIGREENWVKVSTGEYHTVAIKSDGTLWAWGRNEYGQLGDGTTNPNYIPKQIGDDSSWVKVSTGPNNTFGIKSNGALWAWGYNGFGQLGDGSFDDSLVPKPIGDAFDNWIKVSSGYFDTLGIKSKNYQTGDSMNSIKQNTTLWAWGDNGDGQFGDGSFNRSLVPKQTGDAVNWIEVSVGFSHTIGRKSDGTLWAWGLNNHGQLGLGESTPRSLVPKPIGSDNNWRKVSAWSFDSTYATKSDGTLWAWGYNYVGQLGDGTKDNRYEPVRIFPPKPISAIHYLLLNLE